MQPEPSTASTTSEGGDYGGGNNYNFGGRVSNAGFGNQTDSSSIILPSSPNAKRDDLKSMLENSKDGQKLEAMKRLIGMIAKGRPSSDTTAREMFPHVVKNVVTKNAELKKLVYLYLMRYAEQEQDLALLSISSFQRSLKDPNPLIRASALRVLTSIRVPMIAPIMLIAIKDCSNDMSPYVRKTAAHSIPKLYNLDPDLKEEIILIIERLLRDKTSLVLGSAVAAFEEVCSDRLDLIHPHYKKFVSLMADFDEWGQVVLLNMLVRYARTQFVDPNVEAHQHADNDVSNLVLLDPDHRSLLRNSKPLLQSRNSAVVLGVVQLYLYLAPNSEINSLIVKPLIRLLHSRQEIQIIVLTNIATLTSGCSSRMNRDETTPLEDELDMNYNPRELNLKSLFEPYMKSFFIKARDSTPVKILKLRILTNLSSTSNIPLILREFQAYIQNYQGDMEFVSATIRAIGRCASRIKEVAPVCLHGLISLLSNRNEAIVSQSIIVIRTQIISKECDEDESLENSYNSTSAAPSVRTHSIVTSIVKQITKLMDKIKTPNAKATIIWILAEFCDKNLKAIQASPNVLRLTAKSFCSESDLVKLQTLNLASKLFLTTNSKVMDNNFNIFDDKTKERIKLLVNYIFNLAKYDLNYDVRDRGRFLKQLLTNCDTDNGLMLAKRILMSPKATFKSDKVETNTFDAPSKYRVGTLSHFLNRKVPGYCDLPDFPENAPDSNTRSGYGAEEITGATKFALIVKDDMKAKKMEMFYSEDEESEDSEAEEAVEESEEEDEDKSESDDGDEEEEDDEEESSEEDEESEEEESSEEAKAVEIVPKE
ncbi:AP-3 complex subunit beta-2-like protein [Leptotrombidium deliense]|uniref:AP-3 complex subunit beta-2-like protein n=1 Tax=Leptotrombidium deliense TaxID=299467 RepID=A0A443SNV9_9ACAR|nr:AP-3 complex subunit beta-2-like protein [Leptotrombidium deliense]